MNKISNINAFSALPKIALAVGFTLALALSSLSHSVHAMTFPSTELVSVDSNENQSNHISRIGRISGNGQFVTFESLADNLVASDTNSTWDVFVRDLTAGTTEIVSINNAGNQSNGGATWSDISNDGRYVVFQASQLDEFFTFSNQIFLRDRQLGTTELISANNNGDMANLGSFTPNISADGRYVVFISDATNLVANDTNGIADVFIRDRQLGTTDIVSLADDESQGNGGPSNISQSTVSSDGRFVSFISAASNLVTGDTNGEEDAFVRDRQLGTTVRVSTANSGGQAQEHSDRVAISDDGNLAVVRSFSNLDGDGTLFAPGVYVRDIAAGTTIKASPGTAVSLDVTPDGRFVVFQAGNNVVMRDLSDMSLYTVAVGGVAQAANPTLSDSANTFAFQSSGSTFVPNDTNGFTDVFAHFRAEEPNPNLCNGLEPTILGTEGDDVLDGTPGPDVIMGLGGNDTIKGKQGDDVICGGDGDDEIHGDRDNDTLFGDAGNDTIKGNEQNDTITDLEGNNTIQGGQGDDTITTGDGDDDIQGNQSTDIIDAGNGTNIVAGGTGTDTITTGDGNDTIDGNQNADTITSGGGNDIISGGYGDDTVDAGEGDDDIEGNQGNDFLDGGAGTNTIDGGNGTDTCLNGIFTKCEL